MAIVLHYCLFWKRPMGSWIVCFLLGGERAKVKKSSKVSAVMQVKSEASWTLISSSLPLPQDTGLSFNVSDKSSRSLNWGVGTSLTEMGTDRLGTDSGRPLTSGFILDSIL